MCIVSVHSVSYQGDLHFRQCSVTAITCSVIVMADTAPVFLSNLMLKAILQLRQKSNNNLTNSVIHGFHVTLCSAPQ